MSELPTTYSPYGDEYRRPKNLQERALRIVGILSESNIETFGGYPDVCAFIGDLIVIASVTSNEPSLTIDTVQSYVDTWEAELAEDDDQPSKETN